MFFTNIAFFPCWIMLACIALMAFGNIQRAIQAQRREKQRIAEETRRMAAKAAADAEKANTQAERERRKAANQAEKQHLKAEKAARKTQDAANAKAEKDRIRTERNASKATPQEHSEPAQPEPEPQPEPKPTPQPEPQCSGTIPGLNVRGNNQFAGQVVAFTGTLTGMKRSEAIAAVIANGGKAYETMPVSTTILVVGKNPGNTKLDKADQWIGHCRKMTEQEFKARLHMPLTLTLDEFVTYVMASNATTAFEEEAQ